MSETLLLCAIVLLVVAIFLHWFNRNAREDDGVFAGFFERFEGALRLHGRQLDDLRKEMGKLLRSNDKTFDVQCEILKRADGLGVDGEIAELRKERNKESKELITLSKDLLNSATTFCDALQSWPKIKSQSRKKSRRSR